MRFRFRKSWNLPGPFILNASRSGFSLTFKLGRFRRTWGHGRVTTSVDTPGPGGFTGSRPSRRRSAARR